MTILESLIVTRDESFCKICDLTRLTIFLNVIQLDSSFSSTWLEPSRVTKNRNSCRFDRSHWVGPRYHCHFRTYLAEM